MAATTAIHYIVYHQMSPTKACTDGIVSFQLLRHVLLGDYGAIEVVPVPYVHGIDKMEKVMDKIAPGGIVHFADVIPPTSDVNVMQTRGIQVQHVFDHHANDKAMLDFLASRGGKVRYNSEICAAKQIFDELFMGAKPIISLAKQTWATLNVIIIPMLEEIENMRDLVVLPQDHEDQIQALLQGVDVHKRKDDLCFILEHVIDSIDLNPDTALDQMVADMLKTVILNFDTVAVTTIDYVIRNKNAVARVGAVPPPRAVTLNTLKQIKTNGENVRCLYMIRDLGPNKKNIFIAPTDMEDDAATIVQTVKDHCKERGMAITGGGRLRAAAVQVKNDDIDEIIDFLCKL